jgi:hypothetical protein
MTDIKVTMFARWENVNPVPISRLAITGVMDLFGFIN